MADAQDAYMAKKAAKKAARRGRGGEENAKLTITSLMDVVSIIVIYLLKSYSTDPLVITPIADQKVPLSSADAPLEDATPIYVSKRAIMFDGKTIAQIDGEGLVEGASNHLIPALFELMEEEGQKAQDTWEKKNPNAGEGEGWPGKYIIIGDEMLKYATLVDIMATAEKAGFRRANFCVIQGSG